jgi:hypothetical protein
MKWAHGIEHRMNARRQQLTLVLQCLLLGLTTLTAVPAFADQASGAQAAVLGAVLLVSLVVAIAAYVYFALALKTIAEKTNTENPWWAWIPIVQVVLMLNIARKPVWWIVLMFVPIVNIVIALIVWMAIAEARHKPNWWGILMIVPVANLIVPGYLAWSD